MSEQLKPCPFCGAKVMYIYDPATLFPASVYCKKCHMVCKFTHLETKKTDTAGQVMARIAERWNRRDKE